MELDVAISITALQLQEACVRARGCVCHSRLQPALLTFNRICLGNFKHWKLQRRNCFALEIASLPDVEKLRRLCFSLFVPCSRSLIFLFHAAHAHTKPPTERGGVYFTFGIFFRPVYYHMHTKFKQKKPPAFHYAAFRVTPYLSYKLSLSVKMCIRDSRLKLT